MSLKATSDEPLPGSLRAVRRPCIGGVLIVVMALGAYSNSFRGPFVFDDMESIADNPTIRNLWDVRAILSPPRGEGQTVGGRPVVNLSVAINHAISGTDVWSYHALNLAVHILASLTLWGIVRRTLRLSAVPEPLRDAGDGLATAVAVLWAVHPLTTNAVTYIIQRAESLMALFYLLTLYCLIRGTGSKRRALWFCGAVAASALGMASKEVMATAPAVALLYDRTFLAGSFRAALRARWRLYAGLAATWSIVFLLLGGRAATAGFGGAISVHDYALTQLGFVARYLALCFWPHPLVLDYGTPLVASIRQVWPQVVLIGILLAATAWALWRRPMVGFLGAWVFVILAPSSSIVPVITQTGSEHRMYLPLAGVIVAAVLASYWAWRQVVVPALRDSIAAKRVGTLVVVVSVATLAGLTFRRNWDYRSVRAIWTDTLQECPQNARAHYNLGRDLVETGEFASALEQFRAAVQLQPDGVDGVANVGCAQAALGRHEAALVAFDRAAQLAPVRGDIYYNRGVSEYALGHYEQAAADHAQAINLGARQPRVYYARGLAEQKLMRTDEAIDSYTLAVRLKPDFTSAVGERAISYYYAKRYDEAWADVARFRRLGGKPAAEFMERLRSASGRNE